MGVAIVAGVLVALAGWVGNRLPDPHRPNDGRRG